jgi:hypothetical protein
LQQDTSLAAARPIGGGGAPRPAVSEWWWKNGRKTDPKCKKAFAVVSKGFLA